MKTSHSIGPELLLGLDGDIDGPRRAQSRQAFGGNRAPRCCVPRPIWQLRTVIIIMQGNQLQILAQIGWKPTAVVAQRISRRQALYEGA